ncbi:MAG: hypothetical protein IPK28_15065 [Devosia sp.]|nr:hypothetical protein [Devosia sp.]
MAGRTLYDGATSPGAVLDELGNGSAPLVPGSNPTTFQQTGDMGLGALERGMATKYPEQFGQRRADQNAARVTAFEGLRGAGTPDAVVTTLRKRLADLDEQTRRTVEAAGTKAEQDAAALGTGTAPDVAGEQLRSSLEAARAAVKDEERKLWQAVDPDGTLALGATNARKEGKLLLDDLPASAKPPEGEEAAIFQTLGKYRDVMPFSELTALQSRIKTQMRAERFANGESVSYRRLTRLNGAIQKDLKARSRVKSRWKPARWRRGG